MMETDAVLKFKKKMPNGYFESIDQYKSGKKPSVEHSLEKNEA